MSNREAVGTEGENEHGFHSLSLCECACFQKKEKILEVVDYSRLIEEFLRDGRWGRRRKHWGTLRGK